MESVDIRDPKVVGKLTDSTRVIMSFGSAFGGFEFAMQLRYDIMQKLGIGWDDKPAFVYLDAESLKHQKDSSYPWDQQLGIYKMSNPFWKAFYEGALDHARNMIFLLTKQWLTSQYCWEELQFFIDRFDKNANIKPVFVVFPDAVDLLNQNEVALHDGSTRKPSEIWSEMKAVPGSRVIDIRTPPDNSLQTIIVEGESYQYHYQYMCSEAELNEIINSLDLCID
ncbi:MAG: hypothetical protein WAS73_12105 [Defluviicoccus sp.]